MTDASKPERRRSVAVSHRSVARFALVVAAVTFSSFVTVSPASAASLKGIASIVAGQGHACTRLTNGQARCWGSNHFGQVGDGSTDDRGSPVIVTNKLGTGPLKGVAKLSAGIAHTCAVLVNGQARCWGRNGTGQLGDGSDDDRPRPVAVSNVAGTGPLRKVIAIAAGGDHTCALLASHQVRCWGSNNDGELGDGTQRMRQRPVVVKDPSGARPLTGVTQIDAGYEHTCARLGSGQVRCWGFESDGQLGDGGADTSSPLPVAVRKATGPGRLSDVRRVDLGEFYSCALLDSGRARCWGDNRSGQLGDGSTDDRSRPVTVKDSTGSAPLADIAELAAGGESTCGRLENRRARCMGDDDDGQLGDGTASDTARSLSWWSPMAAGRYPGSAQMAVGSRFACARLTTGSARCWGDNSLGQLGDGSFADSLVPVTVIE